MKRKSRFLALLLALLLMLSMPCAVSEEVPAEGAEVGTAEEYAELLRSARTPYDPKTVVFTQAGPFMDAVNVGSATMRRAPRANGEQGNEGVKLSKTATDNRDGSYTLRMEAYTTGEVTTVVKTTPVDFVLVLDQSGSMADTFEGSITRQQAMKTAVNNFISAVYDKYDAEKSDHRIALVTFGGDAQISQHWTDVDEQGKTELQKTVNDLKDPYNTATNVGTGMAHAADLMGSQYSYSGTNTTRQKVVILFTDGVPTTSQNFEVAVANEAIQKARTLKNDGVAVYAIGFFQGANPKQLYGDKGFDRNSNGSVGSNWSDFSWWNIGDIRSYDVPAGNRFLNYISSNFLSTTEIGIKSYKATFLGIGYHGWEITKNFNRNSSGYYLTANDSASLNSIFKTISENIQTADIDLGSEAVVRDVVSPYFDLPADASGVKLYTATAKADGTFNAPAPADASIRAEIQGNALNVTGFDFNANFVSSRMKDDGTYGKKLIIEFTITPKADFIGGNQVPTNDWEQSGVYDKDGTEVKKFADAESTPKVDVPIKSITVTAQEKNVYLKGSLSDAQLTEGYALTLNGKPLEDWQTAYVTIRVAPKNGTSIEHLTDDTTYQLTATIIPKNTTESMVTTITDSAPASIKVHKPVLTFKDSAINLGDNAHYSNNQDPQIIWRHGDEQPIVPESIYGSAPALDCTFNPTAAAFTEDTPVAVSVRINGDDVTQHVSFIRKACTEEGCDHTGDTTVSGADANRVNFVVHVKDFDLTIHVDGWESIDENQSFLFTVTDGEGLTLTVTVKGDGSVTINGLSAGKTYTVTENTGWSWRYTPDSASKTVKPEDVQNGQATVTFRHTRTKGQWLDGNAGNDNRWKQ